MRRFPFFSGLIVGVILSCVGTGLLVLRAAFARSSDPRYELVAVSWGNHTTNHSIWPYQVQITARESGGNGGLDVSARVCLGQGNYYRDLGVIGTASNMGDAVSCFGAIHWQPDRVTIGGADGVKETVLRSELQNHR